MGSQLTSLNLKNIGHLWFFQLQMSMEVLLQDKQPFETITNQFQTITFEIWTDLYAPSSEPLNPWMAAAHLWEQSFALFASGHPCPHIPLRAVPTLVKAWRRAPMQLWKFPKCSWRLWTRRPFRNVWRPSGFTVISYKGSGVQQMESSNQVKLCYMDYVFINSV